MLFGGWAEAQGWGTFAKAQGKNKNFCLCGKLQSSLRFTGAGGSEAGGAGRGRRL